MQETKVEAMPLREHLARYFVFCCFASAETLEGQRVGLEESCEASLQTPTCSDFRGWWYTQSKEQGNTEPGVGIEAWPQHWSLPESCPWYLGAH